jgi:bacterioferritin-associated ferredoxin
MKQKRKQQKKEDEVVCLCNTVTRGTIQGAIKNGCDTMNKIYDQTTAGVGPCGGSCRRKIVPLLETYLKTGTFPEKLIADESDKEKKKA